MTSMGDGCAYRAVALIRSKTGNVALSTHRLAYD